MEVGIHQSGHIRGVDLLSTNYPRMHIGQGVVQRLTVAECLVNGGIETVEDAELELVRTIKEVLDVRERESHVRNACHRCRS
ncbi:hypothetical protein D3C85_1420870 [compost metagenome]